MDPWLNLLPFPAKAMGSGKPNARIHAWKEGEGHPLCGPEVRGYSLFTPQEGPIDCLGCIKAGHAARAAGSAKTPSPIGVTTLDAIATMVGREASRRTGLPFRAMVAGDEKVMIYAERHLSRFPTSFSLQSVIVGEHHAWLMAITPGGKDSRASLKRCMDAFAVQRRSVRCQGNHYSEVLIAPGRDYGVLDACRALVDTIISVVAVSGKPSVETPTPAEAGLAYEQRLTLEMALADIERLERHGEATNHPGVASEWDYDVLMRVRIAPDSDDVSPIAFGDVTEQLGVLFGTAEEADDVAWGEGIAGVESVKAVRPDGVWETLYQAEAR